MRLLCLIALLCFFPRMAFSQLLINSGKGQVISTADGSLVVSSTEKAKPSDAVLDLDLIPVMLPALGQAEDSLDASGQPTPLAELRRVISKLPLTAESVFVDPGCGADARACIVATLISGCHSIGVEIDPARARAARARVAALGLDDRISIICGDSTKFSLSGDVAFVYLWEDTLAALAPSLAKFDAVVSYQHKIPGLAMTQSGDSWFYNKSETEAVAAVTTPAPAVVAYQKPSHPQVDDSGRAFAIYGGVRYYGRKCTNPRCGMCAGIEADLARVRSEWLALVSAAGDPPKETAAGFVGSGAPAPAPRYKTVTEYRKVCRNGRCSWIPVTRKVLIP